MAASVGWPVYPTLRRFMKANGLDKRRRVTSRQTDGADRAEDKLADREIRGYEAEYVGFYVVVRIKHGTSSMPAHEASGTAHDPGLGMTDAPANPIHKCQLMPGRCVGAGGTWRPPGGGNR